jgi:hypothetical protein
MGARQRLTTALRRLLLSMVMAPAPDVIHQTLRRVASMPRFFSIKDNTRARPEDARHKFARSTSQGEIETAKHGKDDLEEVNPIGNVQATVRASSVAISTFVWGCKATVTRTVRSFRQPDGAQILRSGS